MSEILGNLLDSKKNKRIPKVFGGIDTSNLLASYSSNEQQTSTFNYTATQDCYVCIGARPNSADGERHMEVWIDGIHIQVGFGNAPIGIIDVFFPLLKGQTAKFVSRYWNAGKIKIFGIKYI